VYKGINEQKKDLPPPEHAKKGRKPAREMESEPSGEMAVPKKVAPVEREHEPRPKKISKADPPKVADDTPKEKPKRVMTEEHKAKMKAARDAKGLILLLPRLPLKRRRRRSRKSQSPRRKKPRLTLRPRRNRRRNRRRRQC